MLGGDLVEVLQPSHSVAALGHAECDITDEAALQRVFEQHRPELVINAAAYTDVDGCERNPGLAMAVNGDGAGNVRRAAEGVGARVFHISTDYVFDGAQQTPYGERDAVHPVSAYGRSKLEGERQVLEGGGDRSPHLVIRTSWLYGRHRVNFVDRVIEQAQIKGLVKAVTNQRSCLTWTRHLARTTGKLAGKLATGILHLAGTGVCTRFEIAEHIVRKLGCDAKLEPVEWGDLNLPATRPAYSEMTSERLDELHLAPLPEWTTALDEYLTLHGSGK